MRSGYKALPGIMLGAAMSGALLAGPAMAPSGPCAPRQLAAWGKKRSGRSRWRDQKREMRRRLNRDGFLANWERRRFAHQSGAAFRRIVNKMTNHERSVWGRNGYPGLVKKDVKALKPFAAAALRRLEMA